MSSLVPVESERLEVAEWEFRCVGRVYHVVPAIVCSIDNVGSIPCVDVPVVGVSDWELLAFDLGDDVTD